MKFDFKRTLVASSCLLGMVAGTALGQSPVVPGGSHSSMVTKPQMAPSSNGDLNGSAQPGSDRTGPKPADSASVVQPNSKAKPQPGQTVNANGDEPGNDSSSNPVLNVLRHITSFAYNNAEIDDITIKLDKGDVHFHGIDVNKVLQSENRHLAKGEIDDIKITIPSSPKADDGGALNLSDISFNSDFSVNDSSWSGSTVMNIGKFSVNAPKGSAFLDDIDIKVSMVPKGDTTHIDFAYKIDDGKVGDTKIGSMGLTMAIGFNTEALTRYMKENRNYNKAILFNDPVETAQFYSSELKMAQKDLLARGVDLNISKLYYHGDQGDFNANAQLNVPAFPKDDAAGKPFQPNFAYFMMTTSGSAHASITDKLLMTVMQQVMMNDHNKKKAIAHGHQAKHSMTPAERKTAAVKKAKDQVAAWVKSGMLIKKGNDYTVDVVFKNGQLTINGHEAS